MQAITIERVRELDVVSREDVCSFLHNVRLVTIFHSDNVYRIREMAQKAGISPERFSSYVWLQAYIKELACSCNDVPAPEKVAKLLGIDWLDFEDYFLDRAEEFYGQFANERDFDLPRQQSLFKDPWEEEEDLLAYLQEDAGMSGD